MMNRVLGTAALLALAVHALPAEAQSPCSLLAPGKVLTNGQWNQCFQAKQDFGGGGGGGGGPVTGSQVIQALGYTPLNKAGDVMAGKFTSAASTVSSAGLNLSPGVAPSSPQNGDLWVTNSGLFVRAGGVTVGPLSTPTGGSFASLTTANTFTAANTFQQVNVAYRTVSSNTTLTVADNAVCGDVSGGPITITLPPNPIPNGWTISIKDCKRKAGGTALTVAANTGQLIEGAGSQVLNVNGSAINGIWNTAPATPDLDLF